MGNAQVPQDSVTPCLVTGVRNMASGCETAAQSADLPDLCAPLRQWLTGMLGASGMPVWSLAMRDCVVQLVPTVTPYKYRDDQDAQCQSENQDCDVLC